MLIPKAIGVTEQDCLTAIPMKTLGLYLVGPAEGREAPLGFGTAVSWLVTELPE